MYRISPPIRRARGRKPSVWLACGVIVVAATASAATRKPAPDGLPAGKVIFKPWITSDVLADDNLFRRNENQNPESDVERVLSAGVTAHIPFYMSELQLGYEGGSFHYRKGNVENSESHEGTVLLTLNSSNHHTFVFDGAYNRGVTQRQTIDENQEIVRQGIPLARTNLGLEWSRQVAQRPSWTARFQVVDQSYRVVERQPWLDYDGWDFLYDYGQPIYRRGYLSARASLRRQDQFESGAESLITDPLRREEYSGLEVGFRGLVGRSQPLYATLGYGKLEYKDVIQGDAPSSYSGVVGTVTWRLPVGSASNLSLSAIRRPLSSFYNTYYLVNELRARFDRPLGQLSRYGVSTLFSRNRYGDVVVDTVTGFNAGRCVANTELPEIIRKDSRKQIEGFWEWFIKPRMGLRLTAGHNRRDSNCDTGFGSYVSNSLGVTFKLGWFD